MAILRTGPTEWSMTRDSEGHRTYKVKHLVKAASTEGPARVINTPGLPIPGAIWNFGVDIDIFAWCRPDASITPVTTHEPNEWWEVEQTFSTKPPDQKKSRCQDTKVEDPLLEPQKISGSFVSKAEEATHDRRGRPIVNSAWEQIRGPQVEFDKSRPKIKIEQNVPILNLPLLAAMIDTVNDRTLWTLPRRTVKLSNISWERKFQGTCFIYYTRTFEFDINFKTFDRDILDEGTKVLSGHWHPTQAEWITDNIDGAAPNPRNPRHYIRYKDRRGENGRVVLNGAGTPAGAILAPTSRVVSIINGNVGRKTSDTTAWVPVEYDENDGIITDIWSHNAFYNYSAIVFLSSFDLERYVCINTKDILGRDPLSHPTHWVSVGTTLTDKGRYSSVTTYAKGDYVNDSSEYAPGRIHVEKYSESNFLLLGIPVTF